MHAGRATATVGILDVHASRCQEAQYRRKSSRSVFNRYGHNLTRCNPVAQCTERAFGADGVIDDEPQLPAGLEGEGDDVDVFGG